MNGEPAYTDLQVWNEDIWGNVVAIISIRGQVNRMIGEYMLFTLYATMCPTPYQKPTDIGNNIAYSKRATQVTRKSIKDILERN